LFGFKINYNNSSDPSKALYNGNISQTFWKTLGQDTGLKNYTYDYDALNRLTNAVSHYGGRYNESVSYDKNGNIIGLVRNGHTDANASIFGTMDNLAYTYDSGNKLLKVVDNSGVTEGFKEVNTIVDDYTYDANGNIKTDVNKSITAITYNHLNLPVDISILGGTIHYDYDAKGVKQRKVVNQNTITSYAEGFQYEGIDLKFFPTSEGYVNHSNGIFEYIYQYKDHLGTNRLSYKNSPNGLVIVEENHYYPFGLQQKIPGSVYINSNYKYKYNGKELQDELGLGIYDYGARNYDPALGRWMNIDPLAEISRRWSPYNYAYNNPVYFIDPDGMSPDGPIDDKTSEGRYRDFMNGYDGSQGLMGDAGGDPIDPPKPGQGTSTGNMQGTIPAGQPNAGAPNGVDLPAEVLNEVVVTSNSSSGVTEVISDFWNSPTARLMIPDRLYISFSYNANPYVGTSSDFSLNWITRGNDASFIPYSITTVAVTAGMPNGGLGVSAGAGYFPTMDMRSLPTGVASNGMLGWSYTGTAFGAADGGRVSLTGSVGINGTPLNPTGLSWITGGASVGVGTPGAGFYGGVSYSTPSFGTKKQF